MAVGIVGRASTVVGVAAAAAVIVRCAVDRGEPVAIAVTGSTIVLVAAALVDAVEHRLPDPLVALAAAPPCAVAAVDAAGGDLSTVGRIAGGAALVGGLLLAVHLVDPRGVGFGDVKAGFVLGAALGALAPVLALLALCVACGAGALWAGARRCRTFAFGPWLVGAGLVVALGADLVVPGVVP
jgi:leader peptidase (prepilin peptidase)/N-methyltransferase